MKTNTHPNEPAMIVLYVADTAASTAFYSRLLDRAPARTWPTFALFPFGSGLTLALQQRDDIKPAATAAPGAVELVFNAPGKDAVLAMHERWRQLGLPILQSPADIGFGSTFTAADPDGHRLRVCDASV
jgi:catechol 2,3-dioxygenase-like lactoylglutathione lyase family enzyme